MSREVVLPVIQGKTLRDAVISASNRLNSVKQEVDALNVFPVPDGDTGTNMTMTIMCVQEKSICTE